MTAADDEVIVRELVRELEADVAMYGDGLATALDPIGSYIDGYAAGCRDALEHRRAVWRPLLIARLVGWWRRDRARAKAWRDEVARTGWPLGSVHLPRGGDR